MSGIEGLDDWEREEAARRAEAFETASPRVQSKAAAERARHIALGFYDEEGNPGPNADPVEPEDEEDDE